MSDIGIAKTSLGIRIIRGPNGFVQLDQSRYVRNMLERYDMMDSSFADSLDDRKST